MKRKAKIISVSLNVRILVDEESPEQIITDTIIKNKLKEEIDLGNYTLRTEDDLINPFNIKDAINLALKELYEIILPINFSAKDLIKNRVRDLMGDQFSEDEFENNWEDKVLQSF